MAVLLGRYLGGHNSGVIFPLVGLRSLWGRHTKTFAINTYHDGAPDWPWPIGVVQVAGQVPFSDGASKLLRPLVKFIAKRGLTIFYMTEALPTRESGLVFEGDVLKDRVLPLHNAKTFAHLRGIAVKAFRKAGYFVIPRSRNDLWHEVGTARFGHDPATSVTGHRSARCTALRASTSSMRRCCRRRARSTPALPSSRSRCGRATRSFAS